MRYHLHLVIRYRFERPSGGGRQLLRITPADLPGRQRLLNRALQVTPPAQELRRFTDFFGTAVDELVSPAGLTELVCALTAQIERSMTGAPDQGPDLSLPLVGLPAALQRVTDLGGDSPWNFLSASPRIPPVPEIAAFAKAAVAGCGSICDAVQAFGRALHQEMAFVAGATEVDTTVAEAFAGRKGVCQDYAQIMICGLRALGIPAGYVCGYLATRPPPGQPRLQGADAMHAWSRAWAGPVAGWIEYDATNACWALQHHIAVGHGRDYGDVAPVTGSLRLNGGQSGSHAVDLIEEPEPCPPP